MVTTHRDALCALKMATEQTCPTGSFRATAQVQLLSVGPPALEPDNCVHGTVGGTVDTLFAGYLSFRSDLISQRWVTEEAFPGSTPVGGRPVPVLQVRLLLS